MNLMEKFFYVFFYPTCEGAALFSREAKVGQLKTEKERASRNIRLLISNSEFPFEVPH